MNITKEDQIQIFTILANLINEKGKTKMVSTYDIHPVLTQLDIETTKSIITNVLDVLIQHKYVRYYRDTRGYIYYGITQKGWAKWDTLINHVEVEITQNEVAPTKTEQCAIQDKWKPCIKSSKKRGEKNG